jgi:hypothetical protein
LRFARTDLEVRRHGHGRYLNISIPPIPANDLEKPGKILPEKPLLTATHADRIGTSETTEKGNEMKRKILTRVAMIAIPLAGIAAFGILSHGPDSAAASPNCPTEDSCYADYRDGAWHIMEGSRPKNDVPSPTNWLPVSSCEDEPVDGNSPVYCITFDQGPAGERQYLMRR